MANPPNDELSHYRPVCAAISKLLPGLVEVVLHDLASGTIAHIENNLSLRAVGDDSLLETDGYKTELESDGTIGPYPKSQANGSKLKSISAVLRDSAGQDIALLCINMPIDALASAQASLALLTSIANTADSPNTLLKNDWREASNSIISEQLKTLKISAAQAKRADRQAIVAQLQRHAIFESRGSVDYVAQVLGISRASLYSLIKANNNSN